MFSGTHTTLFVVVALAATLVLPGTVAGATSTFPATVDADQEASADVLDVGSVQENNTTAGANNSSLTPERVVSLIEDGRAGERAEDVAGWLQGNAENLSNEQAVTAYRWLLARGATARGSVDGPALNAVAEQLDENRAADVVDDVRDRLPSEDVARLRDRLDGVGAGWSLDVAGWLQGYGDEPTSTTTTATTTSEPATTTTSAPTSSTSGEEPAGNGSGYSEAGYGIVSAIREDFASPDPTSVAATLRPNLFVEDVEWKDDYALLTVVNGRPRAETLAVSDTNDIDTSGGHFTGDKEVLTVPTGRFVIKVGATKDRGDQTITVDVAGTDGYDGFSNDGGGGARNPWGVGGAAVGWSGGISAGVVMGLLAHRRAGKSTRPNVERLSNLKY